MKKILFSLAAIVSLSCSTFGQGVTFIAEVDELLVAGNPINHADRDNLNLNAFGFFVSSANFAAFSSNAIWTGSESTITDADWGNISSFLNSNGAGGGSTIAEPPLTIFPVFQGLVNSGGAGNHAVFIVHDAANLASIGVGNYVGIVTTTAQTTDISDIPIGFNTGQSWNTTLLGIAGSLSLAQVTAVPEPSAFALLAGCFGLAWVMVRRRASR